MESTGRLERHRLNVPGDFYVENECCTACGVPESIAPALIGLTEEEVRHCYWKKQPNTDEEIKQAIDILHSQELGCHRYAGNDPNILKRLPRNCCDAFSAPPLAPAGNLVSDGEIRSESPSQRGSLLSRVWKTILRK
jgi:hypothetical protein